MRILITTDAFPPNCGGSGWSTYELVRGLRGLGHHISILQPRPGTRTGIRERKYDGFTVQEFGIEAPDIPYVRNYFKSERLTRRLGNHLRQQLRLQQHDVVHSQHVLTTVASIEAGRLAGVPSVATVRDYWPVCYWSDLLRTRAGLELCPECSVQNMMQCIRPRAGAAWPLAVPLIPYMRGNLRSKREGLARANAIIAVSRRLANDLVVRAPVLRSVRVEVIPNPVDVTALRSFGDTPPLADHPYALYLGKLAPNKGTQYLLDVFKRSGLDWPVVIIGDGPDRAHLERDLLASGVKVSFTGWLDKDLAMQWLAHASLLIFPSRGPESLSRVLIEASALGVPIAAMDTGGTRDIVESGVTGLLSSSPEGLADDVRRLRQDAPLRKRLGDAARRRVESEFDTAQVVARVEHLYRQLVTPL